MRAFFPYPGSKATLMPHLVKLLPHHEHYVSVFGGSAADILFKPPSKLETFNDLDGLVHKVFAVALNGDADLLRRRILDTPNLSKRVFDEALGILKGPVADPVVSAWAFLVVANQSFCHRHPSLMTAGGWQRFKKPHNSLRWVHLADTLALVRRRMRYVQLDNRDWPQVIDGYDSPTTLFYLDSPYSPEVITDRLYACTMSMEQHETMLRRLQTIAGKAVVSGYHSPVYDTLLAHWRREEIPVRCRINFTPARPPRREVIWMNYAAEAGAAALRPGRPFSSAEQV